MASDLAQNGTRAVAVYARKPADLLEVVRITRPVESTVVLDRSPYLEPLVAEAHERWCVLLANRRNARFFVGDGGGLEETDRVEDDVHSQHDQGGWSQARYQRGVEKRRTTTSCTWPRSPSARTRSAASTGCWSAPDELVGELEQKLHLVPARADRRPPAPTSRTSVEDVRGAANAAIEDWRRRVEREALDRLAEGVGARGAAGLAAVLQGAQRAEGWTRCWSARRSARPVAATRRPMLYAGDHGRRSSSSAARTSSSRRSRRRSSSRRA